MSDTVHMLETMHETHVGHLLPRVQAAHAAVEAFAVQCLECKVGCFFCSLLSSWLSWPSFRPLSPHTRPCRPSSHPLACPLLQNALTRDVAGQLRTISSQQSKIREMKNKLELFRRVPRPEVHCTCRLANRSALQLLQQRRTVDTPVCFTPPLLIPSREALARQDGAVQELLVVRRVPAAYKQCLAECVRR